MGDGRTGPVGWSGYVGQAGEHRREYTHGDVCLISFFGFHFWLFSLFSFFLGLSPARRIDDDGERDYIVCMGLSGSVSVFVGKCGEKNESAACSSASLPPGPVYY